MEDQVILNKGIQIWTVPVTGSCVIEASGASGGNGTKADSVSPFHWKWKRGGLGAKITGTFQVIQGTQLKILVGQEGGTKADFPSRPGGGGGGSFVTLQDDNHLSLPVGVVEGVQVIISQTVTQGRQQGTGHGVVEQREVGVRCAMLTREKLTPS